MRSGLLPALASALAVAATAAPAAADPANPGHDANVVIVGAWRVLFSPLVNVTMVGVDVPFLIAVANAETGEPVEAGPVRATLAPEGGGTARAVALEPAEPGAHRGVLRFDTGGSWPLTVALGEDAVEARFLVRAWPWSPHWLAHSGPLDGALLQGRPTDSLRFTAFNTTTGSVAPAPLDAVLRVERWGEEATGALAAWETRLAPTSAPGEVGVEAFTFHGAGLHLLRVSVPSLGVDGAKLPAMDVWVMADGAHVAGEWARETPVPPAGAGLAVVAAAGLALARGSR